ncbi:histidine kinase [Alkaliphilus metalliredigens QYMF]|uniref:Circadian input-output histidine kinase CikA n=1 Tax=Alkaliphilus metalliredigens (strain QYMF) TaxID=293826 RepID=A6TM12_ALKMQ|nr:ATP-binding protein [Alkaliphilus metalliredigens]ABR47230.1 histidine kinase [Alkaliphilus metalliredigens QYMF]
MNKTRKEKCSEKDEVYLERARSNESEFVRSIIHEIRTPLNSIIGMAELMSITDLTLEQQNYIETIQLSGQILINTVNDFLELSKMEFKGLTIDDEVFELNELIEDVLKIMDEKIKKKKLRLNKKVDLLSEFHVKGDKLRVQQILLNLISNAVKFTEEGKIEVICEIAHEREEIVEIQFEVIDTGGGIAPESIDIIFDPFTQINRTESHEGTGLGLSICKKLVELMGGEIGVESQLRNGTRFWVRIPLKKAVNVLKEKEKLDYNFLNKNSQILKQEQVDSKKRIPTILVAEDDLLNQKIISAQLKVLGYDFEIVSDGGEVLRALGKNHYDLILMDYHMVGINGLKTTEMIRKMEEKTQRHTMIIALTASAIAEAKQEGTKRGMDDYLSKPINLNELSEKLNKHLRRAQDIHIKTAKDSAAFSPEEPQYDAIDVRLLKEILEDNNDLLYEIIKEYLAEAKEKIKLLTTYIASENKQNIRYIAHNLKSSSGYMGAEKLCGLAKEMEFIANKETNSIMEMNVKLEEIKSEFLVVSGQLEGLLHGKT